MEGKWCSTEAFSVVKLASSSLMESFSGGVMYILGVWELWMENASSHKRIYRTMQSFVAQD